MGKRAARGRELTGILLLDKPDGITSNRALQQVKGLYFAKKAGHTGSLDPLATGMLPLCFGQATKFSQFLLDADKTYQVTAQLGVRTTTCDAEGEAVDTKDASHVNADNLEACLAQFRGPIEQIPSMYSALKHKGQPLYKLARQGIEVERPPRKVTIHECRLDNFDSSSAQFSLTVSCSKGTYIRNLVDDIGQVLDCGAHVVVLRRIGVANLSKQPMYTIDVLDSLRDEEQFAELDNLLLPLSAALFPYPILNLESASVFRLRNGDKLPCPNSQEGNVCIMLGEEFIGISNVSAEQQLSAVRFINHTL